jgi:hypothetical protein
MNFAVLFFPSSFCRLLFIRLSSDADRRGHAERMLQTLPSVDWGKGNQATKRGCPDSQNMSIFLISPVTVSRPRLLVVSDGFVVRDHT